MFSDLLEGLIEDFESVIGFGCVGAPEFGIDLFSNFLSELNVGLENIPIFEI